MIIEHDHDHELDDEHGYEPAPDRDPRGEFESLEIEPDETWDDAALLDDAVDATAAIHGAGGDADRAESIIEATRRPREDEAIPDEERPV